jgi:hypothetical protein
MKFIYIEANPELAVAAEAAGVDRIMVDLEINGKEIRQPNKNTVISQHSLDDVVAVRAALSSAELMVRVNPLFDGTKAEVDAVIARGADRLMLPMFSHPDDVRMFRDIVDGRAKVTYLTETPAALARLPAIAEIEGVDDILLGLNDLHLGFGLDFMFELVADGVIEHAAGVLRDHDVSFGFGGIARLGHGRLPAELVLSEHLRVGSTQTILSRDFRQIPDQATFATEVTNLRGYLTEPMDFAANQAELVRITRAIAAEIRARM